MPQNEEKTLTTVVVGSDGSDHAASARRTARRLFGASARYVVVRAVEMQPPTASPSGRFVAGALDPLRDEERDRARREAAQEAEDIAEADVSIHIGDGPAADVLMAVAEEVGADAIVVGSRGLGAVKRVVLGSVSSRLVHDSPRPVVVVPG